MHSIKQILPLFFILFSFGNLYSQGTTTLTINSPTPVAIYSARDLVTVKDGSKLTAGVTTTTQLVIDKNVVAPIGINGNPYSGYSIYGTYTIDKNLPVGFTQGSGGVSNGQSNYDIPIPIAPGTGGMIPNVSISYNSSQTNGSAGIGWGISGISSISRVQWDFYHTLSVRPISLTSSDFFALDGNIVWGHAPSYSTDGARRLENDNFTEVKPIGAYTSFLVTTKEGMVMEYGATPDSKLMVNNASNVGVPLVYYISKVTDKYGNYYTYHYYNQNGEVAIKEIKYTGNANAGILPYNSIKFYYDTREDQNTKYFKGNELQTTLILREIDVFCEGQSIKKFVTAYDLIDGKSFLTSITEYGLDNTHLNPTKFGYVNTNNFYPEQSVNITAAQLPALADYKVADFNGDGKSDVLAYLYNNPIDISSGQRLYYGWELYINQNDGTTYSKVDSKFGNFFPYSYYGVPNTYSPDAEGTTSINLNGDDKEDALFLTSAGGNTSYTVQISNGNGFVPGFMFNLPTGANIIFADIDGDKIPEGIAYYSPTNSLYIVNFKTKLCQVKNASTSVIDPIYSTGTSGTFNIIQTIDYDGDGVQELLVEINSKWRVLKVGQYNPNANQGASNFILTVLATDDIFALPTTGAYSYENMFADFNGDGLTDNLTRATTPNIQFPNSVPNSFFLRYNKNKYDATNSSFYKYPTTPMAGIIPGRNDIDRKMLLADMNNDGKTDIITLIRSLTYNEIGIFVSYAPDFGNRIHVGEIDGTTFPDAINYNYYTGQAYPSNGNDNAEFALGDFDGDGYTDIMFKNTNKDASNINKGERTIFYNHPSTTEGKLEIATNGFNQSVKFNYKTLAKGGIYTKGTGAVYPFVDMQSPMKVVSSMMTQDANGNFYSTDYTYAGAKIHQQGKGFLGFDKISSVNNLLQTKSETTYDLNTTYAQRTPINSKNYLLSNLSSPISESQNSYSYIFSNGDPSLPIGHFLKLNQTISYDYLHGTNTITDFTYDNYHNPLLTTVNSNSGLQITTINNTIDANLYGNKYPGYVQSTQVTVTKTGQTSITKTTGYTYFTNGLLDQVTNNASATSCSNNSKYVYNTNIGVPTSVTQNGTRTNTFEYDANFRFVIKSTNPLNHISEAIYDNRFGVPLKTIDITNLTTNYSYDAYGQNLSVTTPDNNTVNSITKWYDSNDDISGDPFPATNILITTQVNAPNSPFSRSFYTATGLNVKNITEGFNQNFASNRSTYTNKGQLDIAKATYLIPCTNPALVLTSSNTYDNLNRPTNSNITDGTSSLNTTVAYSQSGGNNSITVTTPDGKTKTTTTDATGAVKTVNDNAGTLTFDYYSDGQVKTTALNGVTTNNYTYDGCGNIATQNEPNNGITTISIDGFGQITSKLNDGKTYSYNYDVSGRPLNFTGPEGTYLYSYITSGAGLESLETETAPNGTMNKYYYDGFNRTYKVEEVVGSTYATLMEYDQYSNPIKYTYPSGFAIKMEYNNLGYPTTIKNSATNNLIWQADEINNFGDYNKFTLGNNIQTTNTYNNFGMLTNTSSGNKFDHTYNFNIRSGNLISLKDNLKNLIENHQYDNLDRLTNSTVTDLFTTTNLPALTLTFDPNGNITNKSDVGDYKYLGTKPNAVQFVKNPNNIISQVQQDITYTAFEKAVNIIEGDEQAVITYGPSQERVKTDFSNQVLGTSSTRYYLNNYDKEVKTGMTREVHYINAPTGLVAMHVIENGVANTYFTYCDHLGTPKVITEIKGNIIAEQDFDPWGQRRNPTDWSYTNIPAPPAWLFRGYTGHEHLPQFSLINMNGRMYDPQNARMLSADPILHDASSSQAYNKYSYCINNPLKYTDPSGYDFSFSTKNADVTFNSMYGSNTSGNSYGGNATLNDVDLSSNTNGRGYSGIPHNNTPLNGHTEASGHWESDETQIADAHNNWKKEDSKDYFEVTITKDKNGDVYNYSDANIVGYRSDAMYEHTANKGNQIEGGVADMLFGNGFMATMNKHGGNDNPYMYSNAQNAQYSTYVAEVVSMAIPVGEVLQGVKWAGGAVNNALASRYLKYIGESSNFVNGSAKFSFQFGMKNFIYHNSLTSALASKWSTSVFYNSSEAAINSLSLTYPMSRNFAQKTFSGKAFGLFIDGNAAPIGGSTGLGQQFYRTNFGLILNIK